jgi:hypothetical protein
VIFFQVCGQAAAPKQCCVASNIRSSQSNFVEGKVDIFSGLDLKECYGFNLGTVTSSNQFGNYKLLKFERKAQL